MAHSGLAPNGCAGLCCDDFLLDAYGIEQFPEGFLVRLTGSPDDFEATFTCSKWDPNTRRCTVYERRPRICREFGRYCTVEGCKFEEAPVSFDSLLIHTAAVSTFADSGERDSGNNPIEPSETVRTLACRIDERSTGEQLGGRDTVTLNVEVVFEPAAVDALQATSTFVVDGVTYEVMGQPRKINDAVGLHHLEVSARVVTG